MGDAFAITNSSRGDHGHSLRERDDLRQDLPHASGGLHMPSGLDALADQEVSANIQRALRTVTRCHLNTVACAVRSHERNLFLSGYSPRISNTATTVL